MIKRFGFLMFLILLAGTCFAEKQVWNWEVETVAPDGRYSSVTTDAEGNIYASFTASDGIKFAYRPAGQKQKWFVMNVGNDIGFTSITLDSKANPYICFNGHGSLFVAQMVNKVFQVQPIAPHTGTLAYSCAIVVSKDGKPAVTWYHEKSIDGANYLHFKYAVLSDGAWRARTVDMDGQTGKWHNMRLDPSGRTMVAYDGFINGTMKLATFDGSKWDIQVIDVRGKTGGDFNLGMGNSLALDQAGEPHVAYYTSSELRYASRVGNKWNIEKVDNVSPSGAWLGYRSSLVIDKSGKPHVFYQDLGALKHAYKENETWDYQLIVGPGEGDPYEYQSATTDPQGRIILLFRDPSNGLLRAAIGTFGDPPTKQAEADTAKPASANPEATNKAKAHATGKKKPTNATTEKK